jgi:hypothetical protein
MTSSSSHELVEPKKPFNGLDTASGPPSGSPLRQKSSAVDRSDAVASPDASSPSAHLYRLTLSWLITGWIDYGSCQPLPLAVRAGNAAGAGIAGNTSPTRQRGNDAGEGRKKTPATVRVAG